MTNREVTGEPWDVDLGDVEVLDRDGRAVELRTIWDQRPIVLALIRHFG
jgi:hypothetical protein